MNMDDLEKEFVANKTFATIIKASSGSGGGAGSGSGNGGSGASPSGKKLSEMTGAERTALYTSNKPEFDRLKAAERFDKPVYQR